VTGAVDPNPPAWGRAIVGAMLGALVGEVAHGGVAVVLGLLFGATVGAFWSFDDE
jgi:hypothetical protein